MSVATSITMLLFFFVHLYLAMFLFLCLQQKSIWTASLDSPMQLGWGNLYSNQMMLTFILGPLSISDGRDDWYME
jgi:hypothetical protein